MPYNECEVLFGPEKMLTFLPSRKQYIKVLSWPTACMEQYSSTRQNRESIQLSSWLPDLELLSHRSSACEIVTAASGRNSSSHQAYETSQTKTAGTMCGHMACESWRDSRDLLLAGSAANNVNTASPGIPVKQKLWLEKQQGFYSGQPKDPDCLNAGQIEAQPCYKSECHLSDIIPHGLKVSCEESLQNLEFQIDVKDGKFQVLNDFPGGWPIIMSEFVFLRLLSK